MKLVKVTWIDSLSSTGKWVWSDEIDIKDYRKKYLHTSVGYVVVDNKYFLGLTSDIENYEYEGGYRSVTAPIMIPKECIKKIKTLEEKK